VFISSSCTTAQILSSISTWVRWRVPNSKACALFESEILCNLQSLVITWLIITWAFNGQFAPRRSIWIVAHSGQIQSVDFLFMQRSCSFIHLTFRSCILLLYHFKFATKKNYLKRSQNKRIADISFYNQTTIMKWIDFADWKHKYGCEKISCCYRNCWFQFIYIILRCFQLIAYWWNVTFFVSDENSPIKPMDSVRKFVKNTMTNLNNENDAVPKHQGLTNSSPLPSRHSTVVLSLRSFILGITVTVASLLFKVPR